MTNAQISLTFVLLVRVIYTLTCWAATVSNHWGAAAVYREAAHTTGRILPDRLFW